MLVSRQGAIPQANSHECSMDLLFILDGIILQFFEGVLGDVSGSHGVVPDRDGVSGDLKEALGTIHIPVSVCARHREKRVSTLVEGTRTIPNPITCCSFMIHWYSHDYHMTNTLTLLTFQICSCARNSRCLWGWNRGACRSSTGLEGGRYAEGGKEGGREGGRGGEGEWEGGSQLNNVIVQYASPILYFLPALAHSSG